MPNGIIEIGAAFGAGLLSTLTPCVYPMIPITLSIFGATGEVSRRERGLLALLYVLGIAVTYTTLGMITAKTGMVFGSLLGSPIVVAVLALFLVVLGLHSLEVINLPLAGVQSAAQRIGGRGRAGAFFMGLVSGFVAAPCVGPVLAIVLLQAAKSESALWGSTLLFTYSIGLGLPFLILGIFSGGLSRLPRSGNWLLFIKSLIAALVFATALHLIASVNESTMALLKSLGTSLTVSLFAVGLLLMLRTQRSALRTVRLASTLLVAGAAYAALISFERAPASPGSHQVAWLTSATDSLRAGAAQGRVVMIDMFADWCTACKELEHRTFSDERVAEKLTNEFVAARVDFTEETPESEAMSERYKVVGLPCVLFLDSKGDEIPGARITGFMEPEEFLAHLEKLNNAKGV